MLDPKKKKIYIGIICGCVLITIGILMKGAGSLSPSSTDTSVNTGLLPVASNTTDQSVTGDKTAKAYVVPKVFPTSTDFDTSVFRSSAFSTLKSYTPLTLQGDEMGREDPFKPY
jgi:hypothetical protein